MNRASFEATVREGFPLRFAALTRDAHLGRRAKRGDPCSERARGNSARVSPQIKNPRGSGAPCGFPRTPSPQAASLRSAGFIPLPRPQKNRNPLGFLPFRLLNELRPWSLRPCRRGRGDSRALRGEPSPCERPRPSQRRENEAGRPSRSRSRERLF